MRRLPFAVASLLAPSLVPSLVPGPSVPAGKWLRDVRILADDSLAGGDTGTGREDGPLHRFVPPEAF